MGNNKKKFRKLIYLLSKQYYPFFGYGNSLFEAIEKDKEYCKNQYERSIGREEIYNLANELNIESKELIKLWFNNYTKRSFGISKYKQKPKPEGRDNKGIFVGGGGDNKNKVRYPSKKRSKRVWKIFYEMFPNNATKDGWNGEKSSKVNKKNKKQK